jgi:hypothetical protein
MEKTNLFSGEGSIFEIGRKQAKREVRNRQIGKGRGRMRSEACGF